MRENGIVALHNFIGGLLRNSIPSNAFDCGLDARWRSTQEFCCSSTSARAYRETRLPHLARRLAQL